MDFDFDRPYQKHRNNKLGTLARRIQNMLQFSHHRQRLNVFLLAIFFLIALPSLLYFQPWRNNLFSDKTQTQQDRGSYWQRFTYSSANNKKEQSPQASPFTCRYADKQSFLKYSPESTRFTIGLVADMDKMSKIIDNSLTKWKSIFKHGTLIRNSLTKKYTLSWNNDVI